jgi:hypothetical protein
MTNTFRGEDGSLHIISHELVDVLNLDLMKVARGIESSLGSMCVGQTNRLMVGRAEKSFSMLAGAFF